MVECTRKRQGRRIGKSTATVGAPLAVVRPSSLGELIHAEVRRTIELNEAARRQPGPDAGIAVLG